MDKPAIIFHPKNRKQLATIQLNGISVGSGESAVPGLTGMLCSFKLIDGDLWEPWSTQETLIMESDTGESEVKIYIIPREDEEGSMGFIQIFD